jgi:hypothetical protein
LGITFGSPPSITATHELVVPRSIPIIFAILVPHRAAALAIDLTRASHLESLIVNLSDVFTSIWVAKLSMRFKSFKIKHKNLDLPTPPQTQEP